MKCPSVASIWPSQSPISQKVTATSVLKNPDTLYTGGSDGSIVWWNISNSDQEIIPVAMLCGHSVKITDLEVCSPVASDGLLGHNDNEVGIESSTGFGALVSASKDGVLCVWSRTSGHCRCRRSLPSSAGIPYVVRVAPWDHRFICVACNFVDMDVIIEDELTESINDDECSPDSRVQKLSHQPSKCTVLVVDSRTLTVVQTVFDGDLSIGLFRYMAVVASGHENGIPSAVVIDSFGNAQFLSIYLDSNSQPKGQETKGSLARYGTDTALWPDCLSHKRQVVSVTTSGPVLGIIFNDCCIFGTVDSPNSLGEFSFRDDFLHLGGESDQFHIIGGFFINYEVVSGEALTNTTLLETKLCVWSNRGLAVVYFLSISEGQLKFKPIYHIPAVLQHQELHCVHLKELSHGLIRVETLVTQFEGMAFGIPHVTLWSSSFQEVYDGVLCPPSKIIREGTLNLTEDSVSQESCTTSSLNSTSELSKLSSQNASSSFPDVYDSCSVQNRRVVSSSIIVSGTLHTPFVVVYGLYSGDIEVITLGFSDQEQDYLCTNPQQDLNSSSHLKLLSGHSGAVLCLAAHTKEPTSSERYPSQILISGGMDCTVRIWNLDTGRLIRVMHHHVAPLRQIILPPLQTPHPWCDCFLSLAENNGIALISLETLQVERIFHGHHSYPSKVTWDGSKGYVACLCQINAGVSDQHDVLFIWDIISGSKDRVLRGAASQAMFDHLSKNVHFEYDTSSAGSASGSALHSKGSLNGVNASIVAADGKSMKEVYSPENSMMVPVNEQSSSLSNELPFKSSSPYPGIAGIMFDLTQLISFSTPGLDGDRCNSEHPNTQMEHDSAESIQDGGSGNEPTSSEVVEKDSYSAQSQIRICRFALSLLHLWDVDGELDTLLINEMKLERPKSFCISSGLEGDMGSLTLTFPGVHSNLELWKTSSEFSAMRSLTIVSLALFLTALSHSHSASCSELAAFYTRNLADKIPSVRPPLLQLLVTFWQDKSQPVRMAARTLFHCAASRAIPPPLCVKCICSEVPNMSILNGTGDTVQTFINSEAKPNTGIPDQAYGRTSSFGIEESHFLNWIESFEVHDWISCVGGTSQDETNSRIIVAAALAIWYSSLVKPTLPMLIIHPLMKVVMAMNVKYSSSAAELLAEGMESTWKHCIGSEISNLIDDIFIQIECVNGATGYSSLEAESVTFKDTLVEVLLPCAAMADVHGFLTVIESQIWSTSSDSPVHTVALMTLVRAMHASPRCFIMHLDKVVNFILQTMDPGNLVLRRTCLQSSMAALKEVAHVFPMVSLNETNTRLAIGDAIVNMNSAKIQVFDLQSFVKVKVLDASGPPGFPNILSGGSEKMHTTAISALSFSPDGEGLVAFSEKGLMIRWWSLGSAWWEKLSRNITPVQCTKLIFVPPWEGFSTNSSRSSIMASMMGHENSSSSMDHVTNSNETESIKLLIHNIDLSYRILWVGERTILLARHLQELGTFQL